jgi:chemotaxis protein methyltransferase CheR
MNCLVSRLDLERFRTAIVRQVGLQYDDAKLGFLGEVLQRRLDSFSHSCDTYLRDLERKPSREEIAALARELTIGETYFFRNNQQFRALAEKVILKRICARPGPGVVRLLSAGCASGEEAYSMAIVAQETVADRSWDVVIRAVDLNPEALQKAARARYSPWALRDMPFDVQRKWFCCDGREMVLDSAVRSAVTFEAANLADNDPNLWQPAFYDAIFCRNVLMYFSPEQMRAVIARIARSLAPGGFLFLGHAETLRGVSDQFHLRHTHETFYYELKESSEVACQRPALSVTEPAPAALIQEPGDDWIDAIRKATDRVAALVPTPSAIRLSFIPPALCWDSAPALDLLRKERFAEALDCVRAGPPAAERDPDVLLLEAALLVHSGQIMVAEDACLRLLQVDEFNAGAHYVLALCREHAGYKSQACEHDRVAAHLDPTFAMPRLHHGRLASRAGDREIARRELKQALILLQREDAFRLLLFGGGFSRKALMALCEVALRECGGRS